ncbi:MAG: hypothetical protein ACOX0F_04415 [Syntrophomonadaceae bacterium]|jgi:hypothetical protein
MKNRKGLPKSYLKGIVGDLRNLAGSNEGRLFMLELFEDIPHDTRPLLIDGLSAFKEEAVAEFIEVLKMEYGKEYEQLCNRALDKLNLAGIPVPVLLPFQGEFYKAYASCSRHTGRITLDIAWNTAQKGIHVECFYLTFNSDGIHSFFLVENMLRVQYERDRKNLLDMTEISFDEACFLVSQAYHLNLRHMSRPALGRFIYQKYLRDRPKFSYDREKALLRRLSRKLTPRQMINSVFHAFKYQDLCYIQSLLSPAKFRLMADFDPAAIVSPTAIFLEGGVRKVQGNVDKASVGAYTIVIEEGEFYYREFQCGLVKERDVWFIDSFEEKHKSCCSSQYNPFCDPAFCRVYEILDIDRLFARLDDLDGVREVKEIPYGMHMRLTYQEDDFNNGVSFMTGVIADLVVNGDEFVAICRDANNLYELHEFLEDDQRRSLLLCEDYQVNVLTAYRYLGGQYISFADVLLEEDNKSIFEDGMRLISAHYLIKDRAAVLERLQALGQDYSFRGSDYHLYYQVEPSQHGLAFVAEYALGASWVTVSTFGDSDMTRVRQQFEHDMYGCLEFDGLEIREDGIFDILTADLKRNYPQLPAMLKELYLNKWVHSRLTLLQGMSPSEACQTEEGNRLLWAMYKKIRNKEGNRFRNGKFNNIILKEYIRKIEQK